METFDNEKRFETAEKECQASTGKAFDDYEKTSDHTAVQLAAFKIQAEKSSLQRKQEAMKRWMDKHREESTKTIIKVCNTARAIVERMAKEKEKEMQEMIAEMEKAHQEELNQIKIEARRDALRAFLKSNAKLIAKQKLEEVRPKSTKMTEVRTMLDESPSKSAQNEDTPFNKVLQINLEDMFNKVKLDNITTSARELSAKPLHKKELPQNRVLPMNLPDRPPKKAKLDDIAEEGPPCETTTKSSPTKTLLQNDELQAGNRPLHMELHETPQKKAKLDYMEEKQPFCEIEMCAIRSLNQPISKQVIIEFARKPRHDITRILEEERYKGTRMETKSPERSAVYKKNAVCLNDDSVDIHKISSIREESCSLSGESTKTLTCNACGRTDTDMLMCGGCYGNFYCDEVCQTRDWQLHQQWCTVEDE